jgi:hypothetical protein
VAGHAGTASAQHAAVVPDGFNTVEGNVSLPGPGGSWAALARLARWAEPDEDVPRDPFKWVGFNGDRGHGDPAHCQVRKGCFPHLHLSWQHGDTPRARPAAWVKVLRFRRVTL